MWQMLIPAAIAAGTSIYNNVSANNRIDKENQKLDKALGELTYSPDDYYTNYSYYQDPELYDTYLQDYNAYDDINVDPNVRAAQQNALDELINLSEAKGLNAIDQQALQEIVAEENRNLQGQNQAIIQDAMQRGIYGSGLEQAQRLQAAQSAANRMNSQDLNVMSQAQQRALDSLAAYGNLAGNMRSQDYNEQAQRAAAANAINQFNVNQMTNANVGNVDNRNKVSQSNTDIYNKQQDSNVQAARDIWSNKADVAALRTNQYNANKSDARAAQQSNNQLIGTLTSAVGAGLSGISNDNNNKNKVATSGV